MNILSAEYLLALSLLTSDAMPGVVPDYMGFYLRQVAVSLDALDKQGAPFYFRGQFEMDNDLRRCRQVYQEVKEKPLPEEANRFPPAEFLWIGICLNKEFIDYADCQEWMHLHRAEFWHEASARAKTIGQIYRSAYNAKTGNFSLPGDPNCYRTVQRNALNELKELLGESDFYNGFLPPAIPVMEQKY